MEAFQRARNPSVSFGSPRNHPCAAAEGQPRVGQGVFRKTKEEGERSSYLYVEVVPVRFSYLSGLKYSGIPQVCGSWVSEAAAPSEEHFTVLS